MSMEAVQFGAELLIGSDDKHDYEQLLTYLLIDEKIKLHLKL